LLYLTKPIGVGLITTAQKKGIARPADLDLAKKSMLTLNKIGAMLAKRTEVHAMTDVTGFGLAGHLIEMVESSGLSAIIDHSKIPVLPCTNHYLALGTSPGGTTRNWQSYGDRVNCASDFDFRIVADPQTSGGLLVSIARDAKDEFEAFMTEHGFLLQPFGSLRTRQITALSIN
jgi:selenide,water dikinase